MIFSASHQYWDDKFLQKKCYSRQVANMTVLFSVHKETTTERPMGVPKRDLGI